MILVKIRCRARGCGKTLAEVTAAPPAGGWLPVPPCRRHDQAHAAISKVLARGENWSGMVLPVAAETLRPAVERARCTGRTQTLAV